MESTNSLKQSMVEEERRYMFQLLRHSLATEPKSLRPSFFNDGIPQAVTYDRHHEQERSASREKSPWQFISQENWSTPSTPPSPGILSEQDLPPTSPFSLGRMTGPPIPIRRTFTPFHSNSTKPIECNKRSGDTGGGGDHHHEGVEKDNEDRKEDVDEDRACCESSLFKRKSSTDPFTGKSSWSPSNGRHIRPQLSSPSGEKVSIKKMKSFSKEKDRIRTWSQDVTMLTSPHR